MKLMDTLNVLLIGEESAGLQALRALEQSGHRIVAVVASPTLRSFGGISLWKMANKLGYRTWEAPCVKQANFACQIQEEKVDLILNVHSLYIIHDAVLSAPRIGCFNMHPGPLPFYAGLNTVSWALYRGADQYGVTIHKIAAKLDAGPIAYQTFFPIAPSDTALSLTSKCVKAGISLLSELLIQAATHPKEIPQISQDLMQREYFRAGVPNNGTLAWTWTAQEVVNFVRACDYVPFHSPWGQPVTRYRGQEIAILKASLTGIENQAPPGTVGPSDQDGVYVACSNEWVRIQRIRCNGQSLNAALVLQCGDQLEEVSSGQKDQPCMRRAEQT